MRTSIILANVRFVMLATALAATCVFPAANPAHIAANLVDSLNALTGGAQVKLVWVQKQFVSDDTTQYLECDSPDRYLYNTGPGTKLVGFDTKEGTGRILDTGLQNYTRPIVDRSGKFIIFNDNNTGTSGNKSYIMSWDGTIARKVLLTGGEAYVVCSWWDKTNSKEYIYAGSPTNEGDNNPDYRWLVQNINRYQLDLTTGAVIANTKTLVFSGAKCSVPWNVAADGSHAGGNMPWPGAHIAVIPAGTLTKINPSSVEQSCHANIAPDASLRFFHAEPAHQYIYIYGPSHTNPAVKSLVTPLPGSKSTYDFNSPRWTNDVNYLTVGCPFTQAWVYTMGLACGTSPKTKAIPANSGGEFYLAKFTSAIDGIAKAIKITDGDWRFRKLQGDGWLSTGEGAIASSSRPLLVAGVSSLRVKVAAGNIEIRLPAGDRAVASIHSLDGRLMRSETLTSTAGRMNTANLHGMFILNVRMTNGTASSTKLSIQ